jgi:hypothetical protein
VTSQFCAGLSHFLGCLLQTVLNTRQRRRAENRSIMKQEKNDPTLGAQSPLFVCDLFSEKAKVVEITVV